MSNRTFKVGDVISMNEVDELDTYYRMKALMWATDEKEHRYVHEIQKDLEKSTKFKIVELPEMD
ncbi:hypothetical protein KAU11_07760 [Candidatus Babeliales bacterium]|nr:hypothetical protein [Candidatus Babeliales bacterium]